MLLDGNRRQAGPKCLRQEEHQKKARWAAKQPLAASMPYADTADGRQIPAGLCYTSQLWLHSETPRPTMHSQKPEAAQRIESSSFLGEYILLPRRKTDHNQKGTRLKPLGVTLNLKITPDAKGPRNQVWSTWHCIYNQSLYYPEGPLECH